MHRKSLQVRIESLSWGEIMSELIHPCPSNDAIRQRLLVGASILAFVACIAPADPSFAEISSQPQVWIELGGELNELKGLGDSYGPPFSAKLVADGFDSPLKAQSIAHKGFSEDLAISFQPERLDWVFSVALRYGRTSAGSIKHQQTPGCPCQVTVPTSSGGTYTGTISKPGARFSETRPRTTESHMLLDFQAGKDVALGLFGRETSSTVSFGVRFAQFSSKQILMMHADPDFTIPRAFLKYPQIHHSYQVNSEFQRNFHGIGPSLAWKASTPIMGSVDSGELAIDWGLNAALLFGRQKTRGQHKTMGTYYRSRPAKYRSNTTIHRTGPANDRTHSVTVPDLGGFAGLSYRYNIAKLNAGYRVDWFFNAVDGGIDARKSEDRAFYGPFASISLGF